MAGTVLSDITKSYGATQVLAGVSLELAPGETVAIIGPSGSGKSTLLNIVGSLDKPTTGTVEHNGVDVTALDGRGLAEFRAKEVGFVFQDHHLLPQLTAIENVMLPTIPSGQASNAAERAAALLERMGISHRADALPSQMSGGERQRAAVARALVNGPKLLLCDEPTGSLDREAGSSMISMLKELASEQSAAVVVVTHNIGHAALLDRAFELVDGRLLPLSAHLRGEGAP